MSVGPKHTIGFHKKQVTKTIEAFLRAGKSEDAILDAVHSQMVEIAAMSRRREERRIAEGPKVRGKPPNMEVHNRVRELFNEGKTVKQIAAAMGTTIDSVHSSIKWQKIELPGAMRHRQAQAREKLRACVEEYARGGVTITELQKKYHVKRIAMIEAIRAAGLSRGSSPGESKYRERDALRAEKRAARAAAKLAAMGAAPGAAEQK